MATLLTIHPLDGDPYPLAVEGEHFADPDQVVIDAELGTDRWFAVPGLVDAHAHLGADSLDALTRPDLPQLEPLRRRARDHLAAGVLLVIDKGWRDDRVLALLDEPPHNRPDLEAAGRLITAPGGYYPGFAEEVEPARLEKAVAASARTPAQWVKLVGDWPRRGVGAVTNFDQASLTRAVQVAHAKGKRVAIHTVAPVTPSMAVAAGVDSIEHGLFLTGDDLVGLGTYRGAWVPTVATMEVLVEWLGADSSGGKLVAGGLDRLRELLPEARKLGVTVLAGSDLSYAHGAIAGEASRLTAYGMQPEDAVWALTAAAREYLGLPAGLRAGDPADAVFLAADPRYDLGTLGSPALVMRRGNVVPGPGR